MTGKNCENCNGAPAAWFCNSDGKPARARARIFVYFLAALGFSEAKPFPCARADR